MKTLFTFIVLFAFTLGVSAQLLAPITFETSADTTGWITFANGADGTEDDIIIVANPAKNSVNSSDSVLQFNVNTDASPWVGMFTDKYEEMVFTETAHTLYVMVYKSVISPLAFKLEKSTNGGATVMEVKVENTVTDEWEAIAIEMTLAIDFTYSRLVFFPDFPASVTGEGSTNYFDNIYNSSMVSVKKMAGASMVVFPNPVENRMAVQYPEMTGLTVSDMLGKTVRSVNFQRANSKVIDLEDLKTGIYFVSVKTESGTYTSKFMKK
jgi:hypothetical protein